jgi:hypothetical protein
LAEDVEEMWKVVPSQITMKGNVMTEKEDSTPESNVNI